MKNIVAKVSKLMQERGIKKVRLGEVLGVKANASQQAKYQKANRFLEGKSSISLEELHKVARFFEKSVDYFLDKDFHYKKVKSGKSQKLAQEGKGYLSWEEVEKYLCGVRGLNENEARVIKNLVDLLANDK